MRHALVFAALALFWGTMNVWLWESEMGEIGAGGGRVSTDVVWERILTAPDPSTLEVRYQGKGAGFIHWYPDPGEDAAGRNLLESEAYVPEGMVRAARGYDVRLEGQVQWASLQTRFRFHLQLSLDTNRVWKTLKLEAGSRPAQLTLEARATDRVLEWRLGQGDGALGARLTFDELQDPRNLFRDLDAPVALALAAPLAQWPASTNLQGALRWEARQGWMPLGNSRIRVYRLRVRLADRHDLVAYVNRAGEILKIELPGGVRLVNEGLGNL
jgi:hypothetical protein